MGCRVWGVGFGVWDVGCRVGGVGFRCLRDMQPPTPSSVEVSLVTRYHKGFSLVKVSLVNYLLHQVSSNLV